MIAILKQLPLCICGEAMEWFASLEEVKLHYEWVKIHGQEEIDTEQDKLMEQAKEKVDWLHLGEKYIAIVGAIIHMNSHDLA